MSTPGRGPGKPAVSTPGRGPGEPAVSTPIKLVIDRARWARGGKGGVSKLLNERGNMCCLGFACRALGIHEDAIRGVGTPHRVDDRFVDSSARLNETTQQAIIVNDDEYMGDGHREELLKPILASLGFDVEFQG